MPSYVQGEALLGEEALSGTAYSEGKSFKSFKIQNGKWSLMTDKAMKKLKLYNLEDDPGETQNLVDERPEIVRQLLRELRQQYEKNIRNPARVEHEGVGIDERAVEQLKTLGYVE